MASVASDKLSQAEREQLAVSYAAFVLSGSGAEVTADSINAVLKAAGVTATPLLVNAFGKALKGKNVSQFFGSVGGGSGSAPVAASTPAATKAADKPAAKK